MPWRDLLGILRAWSCLVLGTVPPDTRYGLGAGTSYREQWILAQAKQNGKITTKAVANRSSICPETARLDLAELLRCGMLAKTGDRKGCFYTPGRRGGGKLIWSQ
jgi:predicted HTH transcriptional regulator